MKHTIISWDCSYRNFFHLVDGLLAQEFPRDEFELIYVEQRGRDCADHFNHSLGLMSLGDKHDALKNEMNFDVIYLNEPLDMPYHLGKCNNEGLRRARGEIVSVMDGDQLLPTGFLSALTDVHERDEDAVINVHRKGALYPVGVRRFTSWGDAKVGFEATLKACPDRFVSTPNRVNNFGPMISARKEYWDAIEGYDESRLWATVLSKSGMDVNSRLELVAGKRSYCLQDVFAVHPWHPIGGGALRGEAESLRWFSLQESLIKWSHDNHAPSVSERRQFSQQLEDENRELVDVMSVIENGETEDLRQYSIVKEMVKCKSTQLKSIIRKGLSGWR